MEKSPYLTRVLSALAFLCFTSLSNTPSAHAQTLVHWQSPGTLLRVMLHSSKLSGLLNGPRPDAKTTLAKAHCTADVYRPDAKDGWKVDARNNLTCVYPTELGPKPTETVTLSLAGVGVRAWGNRFDKPVHFEIDQATSLLFYTALKQTWRETPSDPYLSTIKDCGPDGSCIEAYFINAAPTSDSVAALACSQDTAADTQVIQTSCVFLSL